MAKPKPDAKLPRPTTRREAVETIQVVMRGNRWDSLEIARYLKTMGIEGDVEGLSVEDLRIVMGDLERGRMVLFST